MSKKIAKSSSNEDDRLTSRGPRHRQAGLTHPAFGRVKKYKPFILSRVATFRAVLLVQFLDAENESGDQASSRCDAGIEKFYAKFERENAWVVNEARDELARTCPKSRLFASPREFRRWIERHGT